MAKSDNNSVVEAAGLTIGWMCFAATTAMAAKFGVDLYNRGRDDVKDILYSIDNKLYNISEKRKEKRIKDLMDYIDKNGIK